MPSLREEVATALVDTCVFGALDEVNSTLTKETEGTKSYWKFDFAKEGVTGTIKVYDERLIQITWTSTLPGQPSKGKESCKSEKAAKEVLMRFIR